MQDVAHYGGLLDLLYLGVKLGIYPCLIFIGIGAMTDFAPLIANPKSLLLGASAQLGVFVAFAGAIFLGFNAMEAAAIGIIGGADGPTAILVTKTLAPHLLGATCRCGIFLYGPDSDDPTSAHEIADPQEGSADRDGWPASGFQTGEDSLPDHRDHRGDTDRARCRTLGGLSDVRQPVDHLRRHRASFQDRSE